MAAEDSMMSPEEEDKLWDTSLRRGIRSEQRKIIHEVHSKISSFEQCILEVLELFL